jgi:hypothetical protein
MGFSKKAPKKMQKDPKHYIKEPKHYKKDQLSFLGPFLYFFWGVGGDFVFFRGLLFLVFNSIHLFKYHLNSIFCFIFDQSIVSRVLESGRN